VSRSVIPALAQWALHGKSPDGAGYRILSCSTGDLGEAHFFDALSRFTMGAADSLPQAAVGYLKHGTEPGTTYLATIVTWNAAGTAQPYRNVIATRDASGRETTFTSFFCTPYEALAQAGVTYWDLYEAFGAITLPATNGPPMTVPVKISPPGNRAVGGDLAMRTAALLLTGTPVCVRGAANVGMEERLRFIDTVMDLLPYGYRARMAAATWTKATDRTHKFKLFFSTASRSVEPPDHMVTWDEPDQVAIPAGPAADYYKSLSEKLSPISGLLASTRECKFGATEAREALELLGRGKIRVRQPEAKPSTQDVIERALILLALKIKDQDLSGLRTGIRWLENHLKTVPVVDDTRRKHYRELISRLQLLAPQPELKKQEHELYAVLLSLAFGSPLGYEGYRRVEFCLRVAHGTRLHPALLHTIYRVGMADPAVAAIVHAQLDRAERQAWYNSAAVDIVALIKVLAELEILVAHAKIVCGLVLEYFTTCASQYDRPEVRIVLRRNRFLAHVFAALYPDKEEYQYKALHGFLTALYPTGLDTSTAITLLTRGSSPPPTPALFSAMVQLLTSPGDIELVCKAFAYGSASLLSLDSDTAKQLMARMSSAKPQRPLAAPTQKIVLKRPLGQGGSS
jgi:hypothetical protein